MAKKKDKTPIEVIRATFSPKVTIEEAQGVFKASATDKTVSQVIEYQNDIERDHILNAVSDFMKSNGISTAYLLNKDVLTDILTGAKKLKTECDTWQQEYKLAAAANKQLVEKLDSKCDTCPTVEGLKSRNELLETLLFAVVRNSGVLPLGIALKKTEDEIADKTLETIDILKETVDIPKMTELRNKAVKRRKEGNNEKRKKKV